MDTDNIPADTETVMGEPVAEATTEAALPAPAPAAKPARPAVDHEAIARELTASGEGVNVNVSQDELQFLRKLIENPGASYVELLGNTHGTHVELDGVSVPNFLEALDDEAKFSLPTVRSALKKLKAITQAAEAVKTSQAKLRKQLMDNAAKAVRKKAGGREFMLMDELTQRWRGLQIFSNPLELDNRASKRNDDSGSRVFGYLSGSAIAPSSGDHERAVQDLMMRMADHTQVLATAVGLKPESIHRRTVPVPGAYKDDRVAAQLQYVIIVANPQQFRLLIEALENLGELSTLDPSLASNNLLRYNASFGLEGYDEGEYPGGHEREEQGDGGSTLDVAI